MRKVLLAGGAFAALAVAVTLSRSQQTPTPPPDAGGLQIKPEDKNPWTGLKLNTDAQQFQFAVVSDRTGGHREKVFSKAVYQVNLLQPTFVMSVGDLIEGYTQKEDLVKEQWDQFDGFVQKFQMPFFYVPGNHDLSNKMQFAKWGERYGRRYYHFVYKNVLFLCLNSESPPDEMGTIDQEQRQYARKTLEANAGVRWTFVFLHKPIWTARDLEKNGWAEVEKALAGRKYTVFCGHVHRYQKYVRNGNNYYQLATTGGGSKMRGTRYGEFDHVVWVTVRKDGAPVLANVMLDGILPEDLRVPDTDEPGVKRKLLATHPVSGAVTLDGKPLAGATVSFHRYVEDTKRWANVADGLTDATGAFQLSTYARSDGCPAGEFAVTVAFTGRGYYDGEAADRPRLPDRYAAAAKTPLKVTVKEGPNDINIDLTSK